MWEEGFTGAVIIAALLVASYALGAVVKKESITEHCDQFGAFEYQGAIYDCKRRVTP